MSESIVYQIQQQPTHCPARLHVLLPRDGDRTRWTPHGHTSTGHEDLGMLSLKTFLMEGNEKDQSTQSDGATYMNFSTANRQPLRSPSAVPAVFQETGQRPDSLPSAFFKKLSSTLKKQVSSPDCEFLNLVSREGKANLVNSTKRKHSKASRSKIGNWNQFVHAQAEVVLGHICCQCLR